MTAPSCRLCTPVSSSVVLQRSQLAYPGGLPGISTMQVQFKSPPSRTYWGHEVRRPRGRSGSQGNMNGGCVAGWRKKVFKRNSATSGITVNYLLTSYNRLHYLKPPLICWIDYASSNAEQNERENQKKMWRREEEENEKKRHKTEDDRDDKDHNDDDDDGKLRRFNFALKWKKRLRAISLSLTHTHITHHKHAVR